MSATTIRALEKALSISFANQKLLIQALTHRSFGAMHNERLEFLGDGILDFVMADLLFARYPALPEGDLSRMRANLVCQDSLFHIAETLEVGPCLRLGEGELASGGQRRPSILADAVEAILGAVYLDAGFAAAKALIERLFAPILASHDPSVSAKVAAKDAKTRLQEWLQARKKPLPVYRIEKTEGAAHDRSFCASCEVADFSLLVEGHGHSRKAAEQQAAALALQKLGVGG